MTFSKRRRATLGNLENLIYENHRVRVVFRASPSTAAPAKGNAFDSRVVFTDENYVSELRNYIATLAPDVEFEIVAPGGKVNVHGNTKLRTIRCRIKG